MHTNSLVNLIMGAAVSPATLEVGMGATRLGWTDRTPMTIVEIRRNRAGDVTAVVCTDDDYRRVDSNGMSECQEYTYTTRPDRTPIVYTRRLNGSFIRKGNSLKSGERLLIGRRERYYDYSF
jgi:hypothetical protein